MFLGLQVENTSRCIEVYDELPDSVEKPGLHNHPLQKILRSVSEGDFGCDVCHLGGLGAAYHCDECGYDAHPQCVVDEFDAIYNNNKEISSKK